MIRKINKQFPAGDFELIAHVLDPYRIYANFSTRARHNTRLGRLCVASLTKKRSSSRCTSLETVEGSETSLYVDSCTTKSLIESFAKDVARKQSLRSKKFKWR
ncbi:hypothetical protein AVEN_104302-1 [Araneus ventricosus]|uniref:Uncharacterized protein n=1 Tax=Araneus ventricosus TaxID=182803 RepID=A0A4Y2JP57_ARAVE|nr:hypothetical protein AVEN_104302-1 [Araneus ventricosus]